MAKTFFSEAAVVFNCTASRVCNGLLDFVWEIKETLGLGHLSVEVSLCVFKGIVPIQTLRLPLPEECYGFRDI